jgi:hypothetical protein
MKKLIDYLKNERYSLFFEIIVVIIGMLLAMTLDGIREDYKDQKAKNENFIRDKANLLGKYNALKIEVKNDTVNMSNLLNKTKGIHDTIMDFAVYKNIDANDFKECKRCLEYIFTPVDFQINLKTFRKISSLPLYELNYSYLENIESTDENYNLITLLDDANFNIDYYYSNIEGDLHENMKDIKRDIEYNVDFFKVNYPNYYEGLKDLNVNDPIYLNMLIARMNLMDEYTYNLEYNIDDSKELLESLDKAITALEGNSE